MVESDPLREGNMDKSDHLDYQLHTQLPYMNALIMGKCPWGDQLTFANVSAGFAS
jgi:hypothetical protein